MKSAFLSALPYMPQHRKRSRRGNMLTLDDLLDEGRSQKPMAGGELDLILMGYRFAQVFETELHAFTPKKTKPEEMLDLWQLAFGALLTRDRTPAAVLVSEAVEAAKEAFGPHVAPVTNAFLRRVGREHDAILARLEKNPEALLSPALSSRWQSIPEVRSRLAGQLLDRPDSGIPSIDAQGNWALRAIEDFRGGAPLQGIDRSSWDFCQWLAKEVAPELARGPWLDACAAPGGKLVGLAAAAGLLATKPGATPLAYATDAKFQRVERLRANLTRWSLIDRVPSTLLAWGHNDGKIATHIPEGWPAEWPLILADLPCSGSGTLASRPDLLLEDLGERVTSLRPLQSAILLALLEKRAPGGKLVAVVCSVDPEEIDFVSGVLGAKPVYRSLDRLTEGPAQGLIAWVVS